MTMPTYQKTIVLILSRPVEECGEGGWGQRWARVIVNEACVGVACDSGVVFKCDDLIKFINKIRGVDETEKLDAIQKIRAHFAATPVKIPRVFS